MPLECRIPRPAEDEAVSRLDMFGDRSPANPGVDEPDPHPPPPTNPMPTPTEARRPVPLPPPKIGSRSVMVDPDATTLCSDPPPFRAQFEPSLLGDCIQLWARNTLGRVIVPPPTAGMVSYSCRDGVPLPLPSIGSSNTDRSSSSPSPGSPYSSSSCLFPSSLWDRRLGTWVATSSTS